MTIIVNFNFTFAGHFVVVVVIADFCFFFWEFIFKAFISGQ